ncbi:MAG: dephospho-CoA kinase [Deltaproteobacteria bacterium]|nr:dephospho-CoA kinase [Deltaproteobacteria bacterium]
MNAPSKVIDPLAQWRQIVSDPKSELRLLGVTGGIASGKSTVAGMLAELGWPVIDFDLLARRIVGPGRPAWQMIVDHFGPGVVLPDQTLDRKKIGRIVFNDPQKRKDLESFTHPRIYEEAMAELERIGLETPRTVVQLVVPLLYEQRLQEMFHQVLLVYAPREVQIERLTKREAISREEAENILKSQLPMADKSAWADLVIDNSGTLEETRGRVRRLWEALSGGTP